MNEAVVVSACRTAIGTARRGALVDVDPFDLATQVVTAALVRSGVAPEAVDDVILGETLAGGGDIARYAAIEAGLTDIPGLAVNRHCASGLAAVNAGAASILSGMESVVIVGGTHSTSLMPNGRRRIPGSDETEPWMSPSHPNTPEAPNMDMTVTVGWNAAQAAGVSREAMDRWAFDSHQKAIAAIDEGRFVDEIVPLKVAQRDGSLLTFEIDEHPRRSTTLEKLASLPALHPEIEGFSITAGNSAGLNDGAAALTIVSDDVATADGLERLAVIKAWASVGVPPAETGLAPTKSIPKALARAGLSLDDIDLFEINEAFASMCVATTERLGIDAAKVNPNGSGCSLGHPIAMTGARMLVTLIHELRRRGGGTGVAAMCAGGGMSTATVVEVPRN
jgi:acetyl-CoA acetyltransferase family protein